MEKREAISPQVEENILLEQYDHPETLVINGEKIKVADLQPAQLKTEVPTYFAGGFSSSAEDAKNGMLRTALAGRRVLAPFETHGVNTGKKYGDLPNAEVRKMELMLQILEAKGLDRVNVIATSEGAIYVTAAAVLFPEKFQNIVLVEPAGLIGQDDMWKLLKRVAENDTELTKFKKDTAKPATIKDAKYPGTFAMVIKPVLLHLKKSIKEIQAIAKADIRPALKELHQRGIGVSIIHAVDDKVFPMDRVQQMTQAKDIDGFYSVYGTHDNYYLFEPFGQAAEQALSALEQKHSRTTRQ